MALFISNIVLVLDTSGRGAIGRYAAGLAGMLALFKISDIAQSFDHAIMPNQVLFHSQSKVNQEISESCSNIFMEQHLLCLMHNY